MTQPEGGAPGAPAAPAAPASAAPAATAQPGAPASPESTAPGQDPNAPIDFEKLPANVKSYIGQLRQEAGSHRQGKAAAEAKTAGVLKALGLNADGSAISDPETAAAELAQRAEQAEARAWGATVKLSLFDRAPKLGGNANALIDSMSFVDSLDDLVDADPNSAEFKTALDAKIIAAIAANPSLRTNAVQPGGASGGDFSGGSGAGQPITEAQLASMSADEITKAYAEGRLKHLL